MGENTTYTQQGEKNAQLLNHILSLFTTTFFILFLLLPLFYIIKSAFAGEKGFTLAYIRLLYTDKNCATALYNSFRIALATTLLATALALPLALINNSTRYAGKQIFVCLIAFTMFAPPFVGTLGIKHIFSRYGTLNLLLTQLHLTTTSINFLNASSILPIVFIQVLHLYPIMYLSLSTTLANVDPSIDEVSLTLGISPFRRYKDIIWPLIRPGFISSALLIFIAAFSDLGTPLVTNYTSVLSVSIFHHINSLGENPYAYAMVFLMLCTTLFFALLLQHFGKVDSRHKMLAKNYVKRTLYTPNSKEKLLIYLFFGTLLFLSFIPHLSLIITSIGKQWFNSYLPKAYTLEGYRYLLTSGSSLGIGNSLFYAFFATITNMTLGFFIAYVVSHKLGRWHRLVDMLAMLPLFLPGLVLAFGLLITYINTPLNPQRNPTFLLIMAYSMRYLPYVVRNAVASLQQMNPNLEEAATLFGATALQRMRHITFPIILPSIVAGGMIAFSKAIMAVSDSLILVARERYYPIAKVIYGLYSSREEVRASALGIVAMLIVMIVVFAAGQLMTRRMGKIFKVEEA